ncbi:MAG TPA: acyl carrier protein [Gemmatirosa sp.]
MGLDAVEYVMAVEAAFGIELPDAEVRRIATVRELAAVVRARVPTGPTDVCLSQRAFYRVRNAFVRHAGVPRAAVRPGTLLADLLPPEAPTRERAWAAVRADLGPGSRYAVVDVGPVGRLLRGRPSTVADLADEVLAHDPGAFRRLDAPWSDGQIRDVLLRLLDAQVGARTRERGAAVLDAHLVHDIGLS